MIKHAKKLAGKVLASIFWNAHGIIFIDNLKKEKTVIKSGYYARLLKPLEQRDQEKKKDAYCEKKGSFIKVMFQLTHPWKQWQKWMNWSMNCFPTLRNLQIWSPVTIFCFLTWRGDFRGRNLYQMRVSIWNLCIFWGHWTNRTVWKVSKC